MATRSPIVSSPSAAPLVTVAALLCAALIGVGLAVSVPVGVAALIAVLYAPLVLINLPLAIALWVPLIFFQAIPALNAGAKAAGLLIAFAWLATVRNEATLAAIARHRRLLGGLAVLLVWLTVSLLWADDSALARGALWQWYAIALLFLILMTTVTNGRVVRLVIVMFVAGLVASVMVDSLTTGVVTTDDSGDRLEGAAGDPNFLAAMLIVAVVLGIGLAATTRSAAARLSLAAAAILLGVAFVSTGSRGGFVAALLTAVAALVVFRGRRVHVVAVLLVAIGVGVPALSASPETWNRLTNYDDGGTGRVDLWTVAWRMSQDHPVTGVGFNNFRVAAPDYVQQPGLLQRTDYIVERPRFVHNTYLELLAESGVIGLALFVLFVCGCVHAAWRAAKRFESRGERAMGTLSRSVVVASVGMLGAALFLSAAVDMRLWLLLALGPGLLAAAHAPPALRRRGASV